MKETIEELWHGNIIPQEDSRTNSPEMKELLSYRNHLLHMCRNGEIDDSSISERIIDIMKKDANYAIREFANS